MTVAQLATSVLDLLGVLLLGVVGVLAAASVSGQPVPEQLSPLLDLPGPEGLALMRVAVIVAAVAALLLLLKTVTYGLLARSVYRFLGRVHAEVASHTARHFSEMPISFVEGRSSQESAYGVYTGTQAAILGVLGSFAIVLAESTLLVVMGVTLMALDPVITIAGAVLMGSVAVVSHRRLARRMNALGTLLGRITIDTTRSVQEEVSSFRELIVLDRTEYVTQRISSEIWRGSRAMAQSQFTVQLPKLIYDAALVVGGALVVGWVLLTKSPEAAVGSLTLFLAAGSRIVPSLLRVTNQSVSMSHSSGLAEPAYRLINDMQSTARRPGASHGTTSASTAKVASVSGDGFVPCVVVDDVTFTYPGRETPALENIRLTIEPGSHVAFVGGTGAGKSTLADIILGVRQPSDGRVTIGGVTPATATARWPGRIAYVPQSVALTDGTMRQNVALALPDDAIDDDLVWWALERAHLAGFVREAAGGLAAEIGERGVKLSGGQRQRLGLARGLYSNPNLLVMDEATSALDAETEHAITETVSSLAGTVTRITVAHRLATIRSADQVVYLRAGEVAAIGSFEEVRARVPEFNRQSALLGLR